MATRNAAGRKERDLEQARIDTEAAELRQQRLSYPEIARRQKCSVSTAYARVQRAIAAVPYEAVEELRRIELESLDELEQRCRAVLLARHVKIDHGKVIEIDGQPVLDDAQVLHAAAQILRIKEQRAKLTGVYVPARAEVTVHDGDSELDAEIARLLADMGQLEQGEAPVASPGEAEPTHT